ncbi:hypothetical protein [Gloeocapsa sp. PCC 73106]|uniref:hypothetical protein n=1 Tax=Gloeocapsa sp. PCC 73106 TaxID=102232 RepID=UPI0002AC5AE0|nr:hypothetical protein [Gloeocapsa sp. PCC 73106]ELR98852.1 hypothetical protein GLO73106DRAFT_00026900 [Gloeocapsa sp. PCC 73106]
MKLKQIYTIGILFISTLVITIFVYNFWGNKTNLVESQVFEQNMKAQSVIASQQSLGINLGRAAYFSTQWIFVDLLKQGSEWITQNLKPGGPWDSKMKEYIPLDEDGYPLEIPFLAPNGIPQKVVILTANSSYPTGDYLLLFDGEGDLEITGQKMTYRRLGSGSYLITRNGGDRINIAITRSVKGNHVRNMRLIMPGFAENYQEQVFHPLFLERLQGFTVIRFMDLMNTNNNKSVTWADRTRLTSHTQAREAYGVAPEYIAQLANRTQADAWINIPHLADDDYIREFATLLREQLDPSKIIYVEYSNELWNAQFQQTQWLWRVGCENPDTFIPDESNQGKVQPGCNLMLSGINFHVKRLARIAEIFDEVFQDTFSDRIVIVAASQAVNPFLSQQLLERFQDTKLNPKGYQPAALAVAPYFGGNIQREKVLEGITVDELLNLAQANLESRVIANALKQKQIADAHNVALIAYEGGQHIVPPPIQRQNKNLVQNMIEANRHERMGQLYREYLKSWFDTVGGGLFVHFAYVFAPGPFGSWGALETQDQPIDKAPKYQALLDIIDHLQLKQ